MTKYKEQIEKLTRDLKAEKAKTRDSSASVLEKITHIKNVLTNQIEEVSTHTLLALGVNVFCCKTLCSFCSNKYM